MTAKRCPACDHEVTAASARWCGRCGARLARPAGEPAAARNRDASPDAGPVGAVGGSPIVNASGESATAPTSTGDATEAAGLRGATGTLVQGRTLITPDDDLGEADEGHEVEAAPPPARVLRTRIAAAVVAVAAVAGVLALQPEPEIVYPDAGFAEGGGPARTGRVSHAPLEALPASVAWEVDLAVDALDYLSGIEVHEGVVIEHGHRMVGRDPATGAVRWVAPGRQAVRTRGAVVDGLYVQTSGLGTRAVDVETGRLVWEVETQGARVFGSPSSSAVVVQGNDDTLTLLSITDGSVTWTRDLRAELPGVPSISILDVLVEGDRVTVSGSTPAGLSPGNPRSEPVIVSLEAATGIDRWARVADPLPEDNIFPLALHAAGLSAVVEGPRISVLGPDGEELGEPILRDFAGPVSLIDTPDDGPVLIIGNGLTVTGVDPRSGEVLWETTVPAEGGVGLTSRLDAQVRGPVIVTTTETNGGRMRVYTIDAATGSVELVIDDDDTTFSLPWVDRDDRPAVVTGVEGGDRYRVTYLTADVSWEATPATQHGGGPTLRDGIVAAPTATGGLALELATGNVLWRADVGTGDPRPPSLWATPAIGEGAVAIGPQQDQGAGRDRLAGFDLVSGITAWSRSGDSDPPRGRITLAGDRAFVTVGSEVHGYDLVTGRRAFAARSVDGLTAVAVAGGHVVGTPDLESRVPVFARQAIGLDRSTRAMRWRQDAPDACSAPTIAVAGGEVEAEPAPGPDPTEGGPSQVDDAAVPVDLALWGTTTGVKAVDAFTGEVVWEDTVSGPVCRDLAVTDDLVIAAATFDRAIEGLPLAGRPVTDAIAGLRLEDGTGLWTAELPGPVVTSPVLAGDLAIVGLASAQLAAVDVTSGELVSVVDLDGAPAAPPAVSDDGEVVVLLTDGRLVALR